MRKLSGAKDKLGLRVHGLIVGSPEKKRSDPAVLRSICSSILPNGKNEVRKWFPHYAQAPLHVVIYQISPYRLAQPTSKLVEQWAPALRLDSDMT